MPTSRDQVEIAAYSHLGGMQIAKIVSAVDDPELFVPRGEVQNFLIRWQDDQSREADLGANRNDIGLGIFHDSRAVVGVNERERTQANEQEHSAASERFHNEPPAELFLASDKIG